MSHSLTVPRRDLLIRNPAEREPVAESEAVGRVDGLKADAANFPATLNFVHGQRYASNGFTPLGSGCLNNLYVELRYRAIVPRDEDADCNTMFWVKSPDLWVDDVDFHCMLVSTSGAGAWAILLQVSGYIDWELGFFKSDGSVSTASYSVYFSMPIMYKDSMAKTAVLAITPWKLKLPYWLIKIATAVKKLKEIEDIIEEIVKVAGNRCATFDDLVKFLKKHERYLNRLLKSIGSGGGGGVLARTGSDAPQSVHSLRPRPSVRRRG